MTQLSDDCFAAGEARMTAEAALSLLSERLHPITGSETRALDAAAGAILAADIVASREVPPHDNSAVDGYAVYFDDLNIDQPTRLNIGGRAAAGHPLGQPAKRGEAVRIFTGAPVPDGLDTILMQEDCEEQAGTVVVPVGIGRGANFRKAGEDIAAGATILRAGHRLRPQDIGLAASIGRTELPVFAPLSVALFSTGDEIRDAGDALPPGCVYDANRHVLLAALAALGCVVTDLGILPDSGAEIDDALVGAAGIHDVIVTSGGVSVGEEDHVRRTMEQHGSLYFWRLAIRPGRPIALGQIADTPFIGLPGNPAAMLVTFYRFARPALLRLAGAQDISPRLYRVQSGFSHTKKPNRREWLRARLDIGPGGALIAHKFPREGAGILTSMVDADGLVELGEELTAVKAGDMVDFLPFNEVS